MDLEIINIRINAFLAKLSGVGLVVFWTFNAPVVAKAQDEEMISAIRGTYRSFFESTQVEIDLDELICETPSP